MLNRRLGKRRVSNAVLVNSTMLWVLANASHVRKTRITTTKEENLPALIAPWAGLRRKTVSNAKRVVQEHLALLRVKIVKIAWQVNIVPVNMKMVLIRTQLRASVVQLVLQPLSMAV
jgi:hypothetical protein